MSLINHINKANDTFKNEMTLSVIIVNWNTRDLLVQCLRSLVSYSSCENVEYIVVDNASTDDSVNSVKSEFPFVKIICNEENLGYGKGSNIGIRNSTGRYIFLLNTDIKLNNDCLGIITDYFNNNKGVGMVGPKLLNADGSLQLSCRRYPTLWNYFCTSLKLNRILRFPTIFGGEHMTWFDHNTILSVDSLVGAFLSFRSSVFYDVNGFDEDYFMYSEETDFCKKLTNQGWEIVFNPTAQCYHFSGGTSKLDPSRFYKARFVSKYMYWKKHKNLMSCYIFLLITFFRQSIKLITSSFLILSKDSSHYRRVGSIKGSLKVIKWLLSGVPLNTEMN